MNNDIYLTLSVCVGIDLTEVQRWSDFRNVEVQDSNSDRYAHEQLYTTLPINRGDRFIYSDGRTVRQSIFSFSAYKTPANVHVRRRGSFPLRPNLDADILATLEQVLQTAGISLTHYGSDLLNNLQPQFHNRTPQTLDQELDPSQQAVLNNFRDPELSSMHQRGGYGKSVVAHHVADLYTCANYSVLSCCPRNMPPGARTVHSTFGSTPDNLTSTFELQSITASTKDQECKKNIIIDEAFMVSCELLDACKTAIAFFTNNHDTPFADEHLIR